MPGIHDIAGKSAGAVDTEPHAVTDFDKRVESIVRCLIRPDSELLIVDELRRAVEELSEEDYFSLSYFERWISAIGALLTEKGILAKEDLQARMAKIREQMQRSGHA